MVSMTDFLQQQEFVQESAEVEPEKTIEELSAAVVESYMEMAAAFASISNAFECAEIVAFCETSSIQIPDTAKVIVESALDTIKSGLAKAWDWIKQFLTALVAMFAASRIRNLIGKLKAMQREGKTLEGAKAYAAAFDASLVQTLIAYLEYFKTEVIDEINSGKTETNADELNTTLDNLEADLTTLVKIKFKELFAAGKEDSIAVFSSDKFKLKEIVEVTTAGQVLKAAKEAKEAGTDDAKVTLDPTIVMNAIITALEDLNKADIPRRGGKLLKELEFKGKEAKVHAKDKDEQVVIDKAVIRKIEKVARLFARLYDRISIAIAWISDMKDFKDVKPSNKEEFKKDVKAAKEAANKSKVKNLKQESAEVETEGTEVTTEAEEPKIEETQPDVKTESDDTTGAEAPAADEGVVEEQATPEVVTAAQVIAKAAANVDAYFDN